MYGPGDLKPGDLVVIKDKTTYLKHKNKSLYKTNLSNLMQLYAKNYRDLNRLFNINNLQNNLKIKFKNNAVTIHINKVSNFGLNAVPQLIYGLPGENMEIFLQGFDKIYSLQVSNVDIFHIHILPGTKYKQQAKLFGMKYDKNSYELLESKDFSKHDIQILEQLWSVLHHTMHIKLLINQVLNKENIKPSSFFIKFSDYHIKKNQTLPKVWLSRPKYTRVFFVLKNLREFISEIYLTDNPEFSELNNNLSKQLNSRICKIKNIPEDFYNQQCSHIKLKFPMYAN